MTSYPRQRLMCPHTNYRRTRGGYVFRVSYGMVSVIELLTNGCCIQARIGYVRVEYGCAKDAQRRMGGSDQQRPLLALTIAHTYILADAKCPGPHEHAAVPPPPDLCAGTNGHGDAD